MATIPLCNYAREQGKSYNTCYSWHKAGKIPSFKDTGGTIMVNIPDPLPESPKNTLPTKSTIASVDLFESFAAPSRTNRTATIEKLNRFSNIEDGLTPFRKVQGGAGAGTSLYSIRDAVILCQKAYYNLHAVRNAVETMVAFAATPIFWEGGTKRSQEFFRAWWENINGWDTTQQFFRECFRSGNTFVYKFESEISDVEALKLNKVVGNSIRSVADKILLPIKYVILNPAEILISDTLSYLSSLFYRQIEGSELARLKTPVTEVDKEIFDLMPPQVKEQIKKGSTTVLQPLDPKKFRPVFYQKQDYEPFATPMIYSVLDQLSYRIELEKMDNAIARTWQQIILLVTTGAEPDKGGINPKNIEELQNILKNTSIGRALVADYTTKVEWKIPQIENLLNPAKYEKIDQQIREALNNILLGEEKYANTTTKVSVFMERLKPSRELFLKGFLIPEVKRVAEEMGFRSYPIPRFAEINLQDKTQFNRIYSRLVELGAITPDAGIEAIETGRLPSPEENEESQRKFKKLRDEGLFQPLLGKGQEGRPGDDGTPLQSRTPGKIGNSAKYSIAKLAKNLELVRELKAKITKQLTIGKKKPEVLTVDAILSAVVASEPPENWDTTFKAYCAGTKKALPEVMEAVFSVQDYHDTDFITAAVLIHSPEDK